MNVLVNLQAFCPLAKWKYFEYHSNEKIYEIQDHLGQSIGQSHIIGLDIGFLTIIQNLKPLTFFQPAHDIKYHKKRPMEVSTNAAFHRGEEVRP